MLSSSKDLEYWCIDELTMEPCCALKYYPQIDVCQSEKDGDIAAKKLEMELANEEDFGSSCMGQWRSWLWNTFEVSSNVTFHLKYLWTTRPHKRSLQCHYYCYHYHHYYYYYYFPVSLD